MKKRVSWENLELGGRFKIFNTGGYIKRTACRKFISTGGLHSWTDCRKFISTGGWQNWTACRNLFLQTVLCYSLVETLDFHRHLVQAVLQSDCEKGLGTACIVVLCTSVPWPNSIHYRCKTHISHSNQHYHSSPKLTRGLDAFNTDCPLWFGCKL